MRMTLIIKIIIKMKKLSNFMDLKLIIIRIYVYLLIKNCKEMI